MVFHCFLQKMKKKYKNLGQQCTFFEVQSLDTIMLKHQINIHKSLQKFEKRSAKMFKAHKSTCLIRKKIN